MTARTPSTTAPWASQSLNCLKMPFFSAMSATLRSQKRLSTFPLGVTLKFPCSTGLRMPKSICIAVCSNVLTLSVHSFLLIQINVAKLLLSSILLWQIPWEYSWREHQKPLSKTAIITSMKVATKNSWVKKLLFTLEKISCAKLWANKAFAPSLCLTKTTLKTASTSW